VLKIVLLIKVSKIIYVTKIYEDIIIKEVIKKNYLPLDNSDLLCPTLHEFNASGLGGHFVEMNLSMSVNPATSHSIRRSCHSNLPVWFIEFNCIYWYYY